MPRKSGPELDRLTKVAEKLFVLHSKGVRFVTSDNGDLRIDCPEAYRPDNDDLEFLDAHRDRILFLLPFWRVKLFHSLMTPEDTDFLKSCNVNLELSEDSELRTPVVLPQFKPSE